MDRTPQQIVETLGAAQSTMERLQARLSEERDVYDLGDMSVIRTTVRKIEELLTYAAEYEEILCRQLSRTNARVTASSA